MNDLALAVVMGIPLGVGIVLACTRVRFSRRTNSGRRIAPYLSDLSADAHAVAVATGTAVGHRGLSRARVQVFAASLANRGNRDATLEQLLRRAGRAESPSEWMTLRLLWTGAGALIGIAVGGVCGASTASFAPAVGTLVLGALAGWSTPMVTLRRHERARARDLESEMSAGLELLGLCLSAGEDLISALIRIARTGSGPFTAAIRDAVARIDLGVPVTEALHECAAMAGVSSFTRSIEHLTATIERGTPLVEVLAAQGSDVREDAKRRLIESAGKNEVLMLIPLVFLILPVTIAFAVFPGLIAIQSGI